MNRTKDLIDIHDWSKFNPLEPQYFRYNPSIIATGNKIVDVYQTFCMARVNLIYFECNNFGELVDSNDEMSVKFFKSGLLQNALIYYNICIDLSWQVMWVFFNNDSLDLMYDDLYIESTKDCDYKSLVELLKYKAYFPTQYKQIINKLIRHLNSFFYSDFLIMVRNKYNYLKHRGNYYVDGLGMNDEHLAVNIQGTRLLMLRRQELNINEWYDNLIEFDKRFVEYFQFIIDEIMPKDYFDNRFDLTAMFYYYQKIHEYLQNKQANRR